jgi:hypothetical protein
MFNLEYGGTWLIACFGQLEISQQYIGTSLTVYFRLQRYTDHF